MATTQPFARGKNTRFKVYLNSNPTTLFAKSWSIKDRKTHV